MMLIAIIHFIFYNCQKSKDLSNKLLYDRVPEKQKTAATNLKQRNT